MSAKRPETIPPSAARALSALRTIWSAGGTLLRNLLTEDRGGYLEDVALLDLP
jgi:ParB family chromosome partitioning protein